MKANELNNDTLYPIPGYEGLYCINKSGRVHSCRSNKFLSLDSSSGYYAVTLSKNSKSKRHLVHRLLAIIFIDNPSNKPCVNHIDGNKLNNNLSNLEWVTYSENERHSHYVLGKKIIHSDQTKEKIRIKSIGRDMTKQVLSSVKKRAGKPASNVRPVVLNGVEVFPSITGASKAKNVLASAIANNIKGLSKTTKVGIWQYLQAN